ncbi:hypothetical protein HDZ31DRAFT_76964 [Schizophyllum fasciatum]
MAFDNLLNPAPTFPQISHAEGSNFVGGQQQQYPRHASILTFGAAHLNGRFGNDMGAQPFPSAPMFSSTFGASQFGHTSPDSSLQPSVQANVTGLHNLNKENTTAPTSGSKRRRHDSDVGGEWTALSLSFVQRLVEVHELEPASHKRLLVRYKWLMDARRPEVEAQLDLSAYSIALENLQLSKAAVNWMATTKDDLALVVENLKTNFAPSKQTCAYAYKTCRDLIVKPERTNYVEGLKEEVLDIVIANHEAAGLPPLATRIGCAKDKARKMCQTAANNARSALMKDAVHSIHQEVPLKDFAYDIAKDYVREGAAMPLDPKFVGGLAILRTFVQERAAAAAKLSASVPAAGPLDRAQPSAQALAPSMPRGKPKAAEDAAVGTFWSAYERWLSEKHEDHRTKTAWQTFVDEAIIEDNKKFHPASVPATYTASQDSPTFEDDDEMYS